MYYNRCNQMRTYKYCLYIFFICKLFVCIYIPVIYFEILCVFCCKYTDFTNVFLVFLKKYKNLNQYFFRFVL